MEEILVKCAKQKLYVVELRHIFGLLFDEDRQPIQLKEEIKIIQSVLDKVRTENHIDPRHFHVKLIVTGLKIVGKPHIVKMIDSIVEGREYSDLITGFDMVNEEDVTPPILHFVPEILDGKQKDNSHSLPCFFHCGETHDRSN